SLPLAARRIVSGCERGAAASEAANGGASSGQRYDAPQCHEGGGDDALPDRAGVGPDRGRRDVVEGAAVQEDPRRERAVLARRVGALAHGHGRGGAAQVVLRLFVTER